MASQRWFGGPTEQFVTDGYEADAAETDALFNKLSRAFEIMNGYNLRMTMDLKKPLDLDWGPVEPIDEIVGSFNPFAHLADDLYANKMAFMVSLNFPTYSLAEKTQMGPKKWSRKQWAYARMGDMFTSRIPAEPTAAPPRFRWMPRSTSPTTTSTWATCLPIRGSRSSPPT